MFLWNSGRSSIFREMRMSPRCSVSWRFLWMNFAGCC
nr:MAG TPA: hypothetical protein [Caudoviricetes sp.]